MPGSIQTFQGNLLLFRQTYNGAWWFVITYIFLILLSPSAIKMTDHIKPIIVLLISGGIYFVSYVLYFVRPVSVEGYIRSWILEQLLLLGRCQFSFFAGMEFCNLKVIDHIRNILNSDMKRKCYIIAAPLACFLLHCVIQSLIVAPITAIMTLTSFHLWKKPLWVQKIFLFFGRHSTNIWLTHMFFYLTPFKGMVFAAKEPICIYILTLIICVVVSYVIDGIWHLSQISWEKGTSIIRTRRK